jgi:tetratricopeptide (TPR) repeat protein
MLRFARADLLAYQNRNEAAFMSLDSILGLYPMHSLTDEIYLLKAATLERKGDFQGAAGYYQKIIDFHFHDILADDAIFALAALNEKAFGNVEEAMRLYEKILVEYPGSLFVIESRKRFRALRGDDIN